MWSAAIQAYALLSGMQQCTAEVVVLQRCCRSLPLSCEHVAKAFASISAGDNNTEGQQRNLERKEK